jgi:hypothetical protein
VGVPGTRRNRLSRTRRRHRLGPLRQSLRCG